MIRDYKINSKIKKSRNGRGYGQIVLYFFLLSTVLWVIYLQIPKDVFSPQEVSPDGGSVIKLKKRISQSLELPKKILNKSPEKINREKLEPEIQIDENLIEHKVIIGESLASIFQKYALSPQLLHKILNSGKEAKKLAKIKPGQTLKILINQPNTIKELELVLSPIQSIKITKNGSEFLSEGFLKNTEKRLSSAAGIIESSLFVAGQKSGLSDAQIMEMATLFGWDIDFALEIRSGDKFRLIYEEEYIDGEKYKNGAILAAEFINKGKSYNAFQFTSDNGEVNYYDSEGRSKKRAFIRTPIKFARVSSRFSKRRWHPVLKKWRPHKGVDYAAPTGTPIRATGAGKVIFRGWKSGYGRLIIVQHGGVYTTVYAHMSRFSKKVKLHSRVKQGQTIGYVGQTGLATGPHLHYEFRINGVHRNPLTVNLPKAEPLPREIFINFQRQIKQLALRLEKISAHDYFVKKVSDKR